MLWLVWAAMLTPLALTYEVLADLWLGGGGDISFLMLMAAEIALVTAIGIAVVKYRLYAIERLVNRTLVYVTLSPAARRVRRAHARAGVVVGRRLRLGRGGGDARRRDRFPPAAVTGPGLVDRQFDRARYEGVRHVREFEDEVREGRRPPEEIGPALAEALGDPLAELLFWLPETGTFADARG